MNNFRAMVRRPKERSRNGRIRRPTPPKHAAGFPLALKPLKRLGGPLLALPPAHDGNTTVAGELRVGIILRPGWGWNNVQGPLGRARPQGQPVPVSPLTLAGARLSADPVRNLSTVHDQCAGRVAQDASNTRRGELPGARLGAADG